MKIWRCMRQVRQAYHTIIRLRLSRGRGLSSQRMMSSSLSPGIIIFCSFVHNINVIPEKHLNQIQWFYRNPIFVKLIFKWDIALQTCIWMIKASDIDNRHRTNLIYYYQSNSLRWNLHKFNCSAMGCTVTVQHKRVAHS